MKDESKSKNILDDAIRLYNSGTAPEETLSEEAKRSVLGDLRKPGPAPAPLAALFTPIYRMALAGGLPVALIVGFLAWTTIDRDSTADRHDPASVQVAKVGDRVVFTIANGGRDHVIVRSQRADRFDPSGAASVTTGSFVDRLDSGPDVVFYRID